MSGRAVKLGGVLRWILDAAWYLLLAGGGLVVLGFIVFLILGGHLKAEVPVTFRTQPAGSLTGPARGIELTDLSGTLRTRASPLAAAAILIFAVAGWGLVLFGLRQLRVVIRDALAGAPFTGANARRIELIGLTVVAADLVRAVAYLAGELWARNHVHLTRISFAVTFPVQVTVLVAGLLVIVLAEVFRIGHALQQDQDLTI